MLRNNPYQLTDLQYRFVQEYLIDLNATRAYLRAGYKGRDNTAAVQAHRLLRNAKVAAAIATEQQARLQRIQLTQDAVLQEIAALSHSDIRDYIIDDHGNVQLRDGAPDLAMRAVASLKKKIIYTDSGVIYETELKLWNKPASLRMGGDHFGLFKGAEQAPPDIHVHVHSARERLTDRVSQLATRHAEEATNGH